MLVPKDPKRISKSFDDDDENDDEDDVEELERKIRYKKMYLSYELYGKITNSYFIVIFTHIQFNFSLTSSLTSIPLRIEKVHFKFVHSVLWCGFGYMHIFRKTFHSLVEPWWWCLFLTISHS